MSDDNDALSDDSEEEEEWGGVWDDRCREICHDMRLNKSHGDHFASERVTDLLKKNNKCRTHVFLCFFSFNSFFKL